MENLRTPNKTPSKFLENFTREVRESVHRKTNASSSPFCFLPNNLTTPPSRFIKIRNPFEAAINDQLHKQIFSPSVFAEVQNPRHSDKFKWTIEEVSTMQPAQIDVSSMAQFEHSSAEDDVHVQAKIEKYFSETHIVPSPFNQDSTQAPLLPEDSTTSPKSFQDHPKQSCSVWTQTVLSLPPTLPESLEKALLPYFSFTDDQRRQTVDLNSSLCRRLFHFEPETDESTVSSVHSEISVIGSPIMEQQDPDKRKRTYDSSPEGNLIPSELSPIPCSTPRKLNNCEISPIALNMSHVQCRATTSVANESLSPIALARGRNQSFAKADFSGHMSVDNSFNLAPENECIGANQTHLSESPVRSNEFMESSCNWDLEYNNISSNIRPTRRSLFESRHSNEKMDISNLTTPKSKIINSQRKKLSDSFKFSESLNDDEILLDYEEKELKFRKLFHEKLEESSKNEENSQDTGYSTELSQKSNLKDENEELVMETNENWNHIYASTPSKRYFSDVGK